MVEREHIVYVDVRRFAWFRWPRMRSHYINRRSCDEVEALMIMLANDFDLKDAIVMINHTHDGSICEQAVRHVR